MLPVTISPLARLYQWFRGLLGRQEPSRESASVPLAGIRLNLGCGAARLEGYVNIDKDPAAPADMHLVFGELEAAFAPGSLSEAVMLHSVAYLNLWQARNLFRSLHLLLMPGGKLVLETPDVEKCARKLLEAGDSRLRDEEYLEGIRGFYAFGRDDLRNKRDFAPYAFGWTGWFLKRELENAGYADVRILRPRTHVPWRDMRAEAVKPG